MRRDMKILIKSQYTPEGFLSQRYAVYLKHGDETMNVSVGEEDGYGVLLGVAKDIARRWMRFLDLNETDIAVVEEYRMTETFCEEEEMVHYCIDRYGVTRCGFTPRIDEGTSDACSLKKRWPGRRHMITMLEEEVNCPECLEVLKRKKKPAGAGKEKE